MGRARPSHHTRDQGDPHDRRLPDCATALKLAQEMGASTLRSADLAALRAAEHRGPDALAARRPSASRTTASATASTKCRCRSRRSASARQGAPHHGRLDGLRATSQVVDPVRARVSRSPSRPGELGSLVGEPRRGLPTRRVQRCRSSGTTSMDADPEPRIDARALMRAGATAAADGALRKGASRQHGDPLRRRRVRRGPRRIRCEIADRPRERRPRTAMSRAGGCGREPTTRPDQPRG